MAGAGVWRGAPGLHAHPSKDGGTPCQLTCWWVGVGAGLIALPLSLQ